MDEKPIDVAQIPASRWEWLLAAKRRIAALVAGALSLVALAVAVALPLLAGGGEGDPAGPDIVTPLPPDGSTDVTGSVTPGDDGADVPPDDPGGSTGDGTVPGDPGQPGGTGGGEDAVVGPPRAPYLAYRFEGDVWVSREDGTEPVRVAERARGPYALSPDATVLALVEGGSLSLVTVGDGSSIVVGDALPHAPVWSADSASLLYLRESGDNDGETEVWRVTRKPGARPALVAAAGIPSLAADGTIVALPVSGAEPPSGSAEGSLWVLPGGRSPREMPTQGHAVACDIRAGKIVYAVSGIGADGAAGAGEEADPEIRAMRADGTGDRRLVRKPQGPRPFGYGNLMLSPDGTMLLYAEVGDDGYSRAWTVPVAGGTPVPLTVRRDTYPLGWSASGASVFFIEGNAFQGEPTTLMRAGADGLGRRAVIEGAGL